MRLWLAKVTSKSGKVGLVPADAEADAALRKMGEGECAEFNVRKTRSVGWNRKYWALCRAIGENQDPERDEDSIDAELRVLAGHFDVLYVANHEVRVPKRIAFNKLDADGWAAYWAKVEQAVSYRFGREYLQEFAA